MKAGNCSRAWRPALGVMLVGALTFAVSAQGGPRETGSSRNTNRPKSETARLITGPSDHMQGVVAGGAGITFRLTPRKDYPGGSYGSAIYTQADISGQTLSLTGTPGRVYLELQLNGWGPQFLRIWETYVDAGDYMSGGGTALVPAAELCANSPECVTDFGSAGPICSAGTCTFAWISKTRTDGIQLAAPVAPCSTNIWDVGNLNNVGGHNYFGVLDQFNPDANQNCGLPDPGTIQYAGAFALDVLAGAEGTYTVGVQPAVTVAQDDTSPDAIDIPIAALLPAIISIPTGSCCFGIGTVGAGCVNGDTESECLARPAFAQFSAGDSCDNPPTDDGCCACLVNGDCNDGDACTNDTCSNCVCSNLNVPTWDAAGGECCDAGTGAQCTPSAPNTCTTAACASTDARGGRGACVVAAIADGEPCAGDGDDNPCTYDDICDGSLTDNCTGTSVNDAAIVCADDEDCQTETGLSAPVCSNFECVCSLVPDLTVEITPSGEDDDNCFDSGDDGEKVVATLHVAAATAPINGGQFLITYDPSCLSYNSAVGVAPYSDQVFGPIVNETAGTIFTVVGVGFGVGDGPSGNADMVELSFTKIGDCNTCQICFANNNPQNTYLADNNGQRVNVNAICGKPIIANNVLTLTTPCSDEGRGDVEGSGCVIKSNVDCDQMYASLDWDTPSVTDSCGNATVVCEGEHQSGLIYSQGMAMNGGNIGIGFSNFCCTATSDWCGQEDEQCWTVEVNDRTSLDVKVALSPSSQSKPGDELSRCIKFTLYENTIQAPFYFEQVLEFGGVNEFIGKTKDAVKIPGHGRWDCISAWDQLHTLRSCYLFDNDEDCVDGVLHAEFAGDPAFGGNWLLSGNLDGWKKNDGDANTNPSLFVIDVLDYAAMTAEWNEDYDTGDTDCNTVGPHADIDGDGLVGLSDFGFISMNFLASAKNCCGAVNLPAGGVQGVTEISVTQLRLQGQGELAVADLNGDGLVNVDDMNLFMQGERPATKNVRGVRKSAGTR